MAQGQGTIQIQRQTGLQLHASMLQLKTTELLEMPALEFKDHIDTELVDNETLERVTKSEASGMDGDTLSYEPKGSDPAAGSEYSDGYDSGDGMGYDDYADTGENGVRDEGDGLPKDIETDDGDVDEYENVSLSALGDQIADYTPDDIPDHLINKSDYETRERLITDTSSLLDDMYEQKADCVLTEQQEKILDYLIGSLDTNGFLDRDLATIADELSFKCYIMTDEQEVGQVLKILQGFDPPGVGARNAKESLLIQIDRLLQIRTLSAKQRKLLKAERMVIDEYFDQMKYGQIKVIEEGTGLTGVRLREIFKAIGKLNPYPCRPLETESGGAQTRYPDFIVETDPMEGSISFHINNSNIPRIRLRHDQIEQLLHLEAKKENMTQRDRESYKLLRDKIERARIFIEAINERRKTLDHVMRAVIELQRDFILTQDIDNLKPLVLKDVAEKSGYDISTVSRVFNEKSVEIDGIVYPLTVFKKRERENAQGEIIERSVIEQMIREIIAAEDKSNPISDKGIAEELKSRGMSIAVRTVAKYRTELGLPPSTAR